MSNDFKYLSLQSLEVAHSFIALLIPVHTARLLLQTYVVIPPFSSKYVLPEVILIGCSFLFLP